MSKGTCSRCGAEKSIFWYPYGFAVSPLPSIRDSTIDRAQYFTLCDKCQQEFTDFMHNEKWLSMDLDPEKLKEMMDDKAPIIIPTAEDYQ